MSQNAIRPSTSDGRANALPSPSTESAIDEQCIRLVGAYEGLVISNKEDLLYVARARALGRPALSILPPTPLKPAERSESRRQSFALPQALAGPRCPHQPPDNTSPGHTRPPTTPATSVQDGQRSNATCFLMIGQIANLRGQLNNFASFSHAPSGAEMAVPAVARCPGHSAERATRSAPRRRCPESPSAVAATFRACGRAA